MYSLISKCGFLLCSLALTIGMGAPAQAGQPFVLENISGYSISKSGLQKIQSLTVDADGRVDAINQKPKGDIQVVDGQGRVVLPGLIDAHGHILSLGRAFTRVDLVGTRSLGEALERIKTFADRYPDKSWITGRGWNQELWEIKEFPSRQDLDNLGLKKPIFLGRIDGHAAWANTAALELAKVDKSTPDPTGGEFLREADGQPNGILVDAAMDSVASVVPKPTLKEELRALELALEHLSSLGITSVHDAGINPDEFQVFKTLADRDRLTVRVYGMLSGAGVSLDAFDEPLVGYRDDRLTVASVKLYQDGALGSRGAALLAPYTDRDRTKGLSFNSPAQLESMVRKSIDKGFQVNIHAIGDSANRVVLDTFEKVSADMPQSRGLRHRIEHAQIVALNDIPRFAELGVIASMQPIHATSDMNMAEKRLGPERIRGGYAWRRFLDAKAVIAAGSDFPVEPANPFYGFYAALTRQDQSGFPSDGWYKDQVMTREETLKAFTVDAAFAAHQEGLLGSLEPGKWADFVVVDRDIMEVPAAEVWQTQVLETWVAGERVYKKAQ